ncbi:MAG: GNAT family N-acetyltransferase [Bacteroidia bacterium]|nr:GNAT family N-acetyltransferase [Bacteroidia bacterium]
MIQYLENQAIDKKKWDDCINNSSNARIYALSWYLDSLCPQWSALVVDDYEAVFAVIWNKKLGFYYLYQPFFCQQLGLFSKDEFDDKLITHIESSLPSKFKFIDICVNAESKFDKSKFEIISRSNQILSLADTYEAIRSNYNSQTKKNLKNAHKSKLKIIEEKEFAAILNLYKDLLSRKVEEIQDHHYETLSTLLSNANEKKCLRSYAVYDKESELVAGILVMFYQDRATILINPSSKKGKELNAYSLLIHHIIQQNCESNLVLDFEGSDIESIANFNKGFGADTEIYFRIKRNNLPSMVKWFKK